MPTVVAIQLDSGESFLAEVDGPSHARGAVRGPAARLEVLAESGKTFETALKNVEQAAEALMKRLRSLSKQPDEVTVEFGVKMSTEGGAIIAKASAEANFKITLNWKASEASGA